MVFSTILAISPPILIHFGYFKAHFVGGRYRNPYPYPYPNLLYLQPVQVQKSLIITIYLHHFWAVLHVFGLVLTVKPSGLQVGCCSWIGRGHWSDTHGNTLAVVRGHPQLYVPLYIPYLPFIFHLHFTLLTSVCYCLAITLL